jgi:hypothetical protein
MLPDSSVKTEPQILYTEEEHPEVEKCYTGGTEISVPDAADGVHFKM